MGNGVLETFLIFKIRATVEADFNGPNFCSSNLL